MRTKTSAEEGTPEGEGSATTSGQKRWHPAKVSERVDTVLQRVL